MMKFFADLLQARVVKEEGASVEKMSSSIRCRQSCRPFFFVIGDRRERAQPIVGGSTHGMVVLHSIRKSG